MINITSENLIPLIKVPSHLPRRATGKKIHISVVYRWVSRGLRGVQLESIRIGGTAYTSTEAIQRFGERLTESGSPPQKKRNAAKSRQKQIDQAAQQVKKLME